MQNPYADWPKDPVELSKLVEKIIARMDDLLRKGEVKECGEFLDAQSGYVIIEGEGSDVRRFCDKSLSWDKATEIHEILPWEKAKELLRKREAMVSTHAKVRPTTTFG